MGDIWDNYDEKEYRDKEAKESRRLADPARKQRIKGIITRVLSRHGELDMRQFQDLVSAVYQLENPGDWVSSSELISWAHGSGGVCVIASFKVRLTSGERHTGVDPIDARLASMQHGLRLLATSNSRQVQHAAWLLNAILPFHTTYRNF